MIGPPSFRPPDVSAGVHIRGSGLYLTVRSPFFCPYLCNMRIIWITPGFAANEQDTNCIPPLQLLAMELVRRGVDMHVIALEYPIEAEWNNEIVGRVYPCQGGNRRWLRWRTFSRARNFAQQIISEKKVEFVHCFWLGPAWVVGNQISRRWNIPQLSTLMGQDVLPKNRYLKMLKSSASSQLVALSPFHNDMLEKNCGIRAAREIAWGIPNHEIPETLPEKRPVDILGVGSLIPVKNWFRWMEVLQLLNGNGLNFQAELIGGGPEMQHLKQYAEQLGLTDRIRFSGDLPRPEVLTRMRQSKVLLHTADFESFGYVFAEAAANGCKVVSTPVGAAPAFGICSDSVSGLAAAVQRVLAKPGVSQKIIYRMEDTANAYLKLYKTPDPEAHFSD